MKGMGRENRECSKCGQKFSTHSSDRKLCHACKPKCREIHHFNKSNK